MISVEEVIRIHEILIERFGGASGLRDKGALESALARPFATFEGKDLYPDFNSKASALIESLVVNHPFNDGNKRIAFTITRLFLIQNDLDLNASQDEKYEFMMRIAQGILGYEQIHEWMVKNTAEI